jgi:hypothetical protein
MFPSFPHLAEAIAAERAADFQREAAAYRRARGVRREAAAAPRAAVRSRGASSRRVPASVARQDTCAASRAI